MNQIPLFPDIPWRDWVELWQKAYSLKYGGSDDSRYAGFIADLKSARNDRELQSALTSAFGWKDQLKNRWEVKLATVTMDHWKRLVESDVVPECWPNGTVYNVFLLHLASGGRHPMIDQHAWRGYCYTTDRSERPEFPGERSAGVRFYQEYENWFNSRLTLSPGIDARSQDKALMVFGQFCNEFRPVIEHHLKTVRRATHCQDILRK